MTSSNLDEVPDALLARSDRGCRRGEALAELGVVIELEHRAQRRRPAVAEQTPAVVDFEPRRRCLGAGAVEEMEFAAVVELPDDGLGRCSRSTTWTSYGHRAA
ncbi:MAG: hypothetical protein WB771_04390 [Solirubrobacterales bacterium]